MYISSLTEPVPPKGVPYILRYDTIDGVQRATPVQAIEIYEGLRIGHSYSVRGSQTIAGVKIQLGEPLSANFKLTENIYKSQQGDLADINFDNTINIAGTLSDDTEFSYNALVK